MRSKISGMEGWETSQEEQNLLELVQLTQNFTFQNNGSKYFIIELVESERNIIMWLQRNTISVDNYLR